MRSMPLSSEEKARVQRKLEELTKRAGESDKRSETLKEEVAEVQERASRIQRRLDEKTKRS
jgi:hypothetical protein